MNKTALAAVALSLGSTIEEAWVLAEQAATQPDEKSAYLHVAQAAGSRTAASLGL
ncbi:hypothetical protein AHiyo4_39900 [Arthrobacter sp. Hiyo4]|nr:hypothetical protein AHiyo4_39900 [Arthrobacter sp. Hiyo4]